MNSTQSDILFLLSVLSPVDLLTMIALAAIMIAVEHRRVGSLKDAWRITIIAAVPLVLWAAACAGIHAPPWLRHLGMFVIWGMVLARQEGFSLRGAVMAATVLLVANVGGNHLLNRAATAAVGQAAGAQR